MPSDEFLTSNFEYFQQPEHWHDKARSLRRSARAVYKLLLSDIRRYDRATCVALRKLKHRRSAPILCNAPDVLPVFVLYGSALENALKGLLVSKDRRLIGSDRLSTKLKSHKLTELARDAGISLSASEEKILKWVTEVVIWKGRYPVPADIRNSQFFHSLDQVSLQNVKECIRALDTVIDRTLSFFPRPRMLVRWPVVVRLDNGS